jgi:hypothetical protein
MLKGIVLFKHFCKCNELHNTVEVVDDDLANLFAQNKFLLSIYGWTGKDIKKESSMFSGEMLESKLIEHALPTALEEMLARLVKECPRDREHLKKVLLSVKGWGWATAGVTK